MKEMLYAEIQNFVNTMDAGHLPEYKIAVLRNIMIEPIGPYLRYNGWQCDLNAQLTFGEYDNVYQEAVGDQPLINNATDCVLIFLKLETLSSRLTRGFAGMDAKAIEEEVGRIENFIEQIVSGIRRKTSGAILFYGFECAVHPAYGVLDAQLSCGQNAVIRRINDSVGAILRQHKSAYFIDANICLARMGVKQYYDQRYWHIGRAPYSREAMRAIAEETFTFIRGLKGKNKKCIVLDCDNVLWGGIIGEDGLANIKLGAGYPGSIYRELQQEVLNYYNRGVLVALCSKNNEEDVWNVFRAHPDMVLKEKHIAAAQINWDNKATNLKRLAETLNIGLDSMVFFDDADFEINLVKQMLPQVSTVHLPSERGVEFRDIIAGCGYFDSLTFSEEDKKRTEMYKAESSRQKLRSEVTDIGTYLRSLEMEIQIAFANSFTIPRIAQLTQKTNQFNLTTKRYTEEDIEKFQDSAEHDVISLALKDKFGDSGLVGVCILSYDNQSASIDSLLLSCRILGRGVEEAFLSEIIKLAQKRGAQTLVGRYIKTNKNEQVQDFYSSHHFKPTQTKTSENIFEYDLTQKYRSDFQYLKNVDSQIEHQKEKA